MTDNEYFQNISEIEKAKELLKRNGYTILEKNKCTVCGQYVNGKNKYFQKRFL